MPQAGNVPDPGPCGKRHRLFFQGSKNPANFQQVQQAFQDDGSSPEVCWY